MFTHQVLLSSTLPPNSAVICFTIEGALLTSVYQSTEITLISPTLPAPIMKLVKRWVQRLWKQYSVDAHDHWALKFSCISI